MSDTKLRLLQQFCAWNNTQWQIITFKMWQLVLNKTSDSDPNKVYGISVFWVRASAQSDKNDQQLLISSYLFWRGWEQKADALYDRKMIWHVAKCFGELELRDSEWHWKTASAMISIPWNVAEKKYYCSALFWKIFTENLVDQGLKRYVHILNSTGHGNEMLLKWEIFTMA